LPYRPLMHDGGGVARQMTSVLLADQDELARRDLRWDLERAGFEVVAEAANGDDAVDLALETRPELCLLASELPRQSGLAAAAIIARVLDGTSVVLMSSDLTVGDVLDAVRAGAAGCVQRDIDPGQLPLILNAVASGESAFPRRELRQALDFLVPQVA
jgi:DNA-binding NarL/FixJ family response regulator